MKAITAMKKFFGLKPGQSLKDFSAEVKELTAEDKRELAELACAEMGVELEGSGS